MKSANDGWIKLKRGEIVNYLLRDDHNALVLLTGIALRARYQSHPSLIGLTFGQAAVGDFKEFGLSEKEYRGAKVRLERYGLVSFSTSPQGTIATLRDSEVYALRDDRETSNLGGLKGGHFSEVNRQKRADERASRGRTKGGQRATNSEGKKDSRKETESIPGSADPEEGAPAAEFQLTEDSGGPETERVPRPRNLILDALAAVGGDDPLQVPPTAWSGVQKCLLNIKAVTPDVTVEEIQRRTANYRLHFPNVTVSHMALTKWWARCDQPPKHPFLRDGEAPPIDPKYQLF